MLALIGCTEYLDAIPATYIVRGVLWSQGERDAQAIDDSTAGVSKAGYKTAFANMIARYRSDIGDSFRLALFRTGHHGTLDRAVETWLGNRIGGIFAHDSSISYVDSKDIYLWAQ